MEAIYEGYHFNENARQFEPLDNTCVYCQKNRAVSPDKNKYLELYKEKDRTNLLIYRSVKYNQITILVPRCNECYRTHSNVKLYSRIFTWLSFFLVLPLGYWFIGGVTGIFVSLISCILIPVYIYTHAEKKFLEIKQIESEGIGAEKVKLVRDFLNDGWAGVSPSA